MWRVSSRSGVATLRTAIHLLLTYLLTLTYLLREQWTRLVECADTVATVPVHWAGHFQC